MRLTYRVWTLLTLTLVAGCSGGEDAEVSEESEAVETELVSRQTETSESDKKEAGADEIVGPFAENLNFFNPPKMFIPLETDDELDLSGDLPPLRLVGFVGAAGDQAMVTIDGKMHLVTAGKRLSGIEIVSVESPTVGLRWGETELTLDFYKPIKSNRTVRKVKPVLTFSQGLSNFEDSQDKNRKSPGPTLASPNPQPRTTLPPLPSLPKLGVAPKSNLSAFPDISGPGIPAP